MRNLRYSFALLLLLLCNGVYAQTHRYQYSHDAAGNRTSRTYQADTGAKSGSAERVDTLKVEGLGDGFKDNAEEDSLSSSLWQSHKQKDTVKYGPLMKTQAEKDAYDSLMLAEAMKVVPFKAQEGASLRSSTSYSVGEIPLQYGVSGSGARTYSVPIFTAPDIKYAPSLSLVYNSQGGYGYGGYGWDLAGLSAITLSNKSLYWDGEIKAANASDTSGVFCLDGVRLVTNDDPATSATYPLVTATGHILAAPHRDSSGYIASFTVLIPDGTRAEYGVPQTFGCTMPSYPLVSSTNISGDRIEYIYSFDELDPQDLRPTLKEIRYGFDSSGNASGRLTFTYIGNTAYSYYAGKKLTHVPRLDIIKSYSGNVTLYTYTLSHQSHADADLLKSISVTNCSGEQLPSLAFSYGADTSPAPAQATLHPTLTVTLPDLFPNDTNFICRRGKFVSGSYNDGLIAYEDLAVYSDDKQYPRHYSCSYPPDKKLFFIHTVSDQATVDTITVGRGFQTAEAVDVDGDGLDEIVMVNCDTTYNAIFSALSDMKIRVYKCNSSGSHTLFKAHTVQVEGALNIGSAYYPYNRTYRWGDFTGEGKVQLLVVSYEENGYSEDQQPSSTLIDLETGQRILYEQNLAQVTPQHENRLICMDIDGDGRTEVCYATNNGLYIYQWEPSTSRFSRITIAGNIPRDPFDSGDMYIADVNSDGYVDIIQAPETGSQWTVFVNTGTGFVARHDNIFQKSSGDRIMFIDIDRDGYCDLMRISGTILYFYGNRDGMGFAPYYTTITAIQAGSKVLPANVIDYTAMSSFVSVCGRKVYNYEYSSYVPPLRHLVQSTDSYGKVIRNTYGYLPQSSLYWTTNPTDINNEAGYQKRVLPIYVLTSANGFISEEAISQRFLREVYSWYDPVVHVRGLGFCGFSRVRTRDILEDRHIFHERRFDPQRRGVQTHSMSYFSDDIGSPFADATFSWSNDSTAYGKLQPRLMQSVSYDRLSGITTTVSYTYDSFDYPTKVITRKSTASATPMPSAVETQYIHSDNTSLYVLGTVASQTTLSSKSLGTPSAMGSRKVFSYDTLLRPVKSETYRVTSTVPAHVATAAYCTSYHASTERWQYDAHGNVIREESAPSGSLVFTGSSYAYDAEGRHLVSSTDPLGLTTAYSDFDIYGNPATVTNHKGQQTHIWRDGWGRTTRTVHPDGTVDSLARAWGGTALYRETARSSGAPEVLTDYDAAGRQVLQMQRRLNTYLKKVQTQYNDRGQVSKVSLPYRYSSPSYWTTYTYDEYGRPTRIAEPSGKTTTWSYSGTSVTERKDGIRTVRTTNAAGLLTSVADSLSTISYTYRDDGQPSSVTTSTGATTTFTYDTLGRRTSMVDPSAGTRGYMYYTGTNGAQTVTESTPLGTISTTSDRFGRTVSVTRPDFSSTYSYDEEGRLTAVVSTNGTSSRYTYDAYDRPLSVKDSVPDGKWLRKDYSYNADGNVAAIAYTSQGGYITTESYSYSGGINTAVTLPDGTDVYRLTAENAFGQPTSASSGSVTRTYGYSTYGLPTSRKLNGGSLQDFGYSFDAATGNLSSRSRTQGGTTTSETFYYDNLGRLTFDNGVSLAYDANNNILYNGGGGVMTYTDASHPYQITERIQQSTDPFGTSTQTITYKAYGRPATITQGSKTATFTYDAGHDRVKMQVDGVSSDGITRYYVGGRYEMLYDDGVATEFLYLGGDAYTAPMVLRRLAGTSWVPYVIGRDYLGSITHIATVDGSEVTHCYYGVWGSRTNTELDDFGLARGWCGHEHLKDFGLINMNARLYDPVLGRFLSPDPYVQAPDLPANFNRYAYGLNNPLKYTDISGEIVTWNIGSKGFSAGINFTPFGIPLGFGISISWADGLFMGLYGEIGYRIGGGGIGAGAAINYTYGFNYGYGQWSGSFNASMYGSFGPFTTSISTSFAGGQTAGSLNVGLGRGDGISGFGLSLGYGSSGVDYGISGYADPFKSAEICDGLKRLSINNSIVPATDAVLKRLQEIWYPYAPMDYIVNYSVEKIPEIVKEWLTDNKLALTWCQTKSDYEGKKISVYFSERAFSSARVLYYTMGHEFVHVCNYITASEIGINYGLIHNSRVFKDMSEYWAHLYESQYTGYNVNGYNLTTFLTYFGPERMALFMFQRMLWYQKRIY